MFVIKEGFIVTVLNSRVWFLFKTETEIGFHSKKHELNARLKLLEPKPNQAK